MFGGYVDLYAYGGTDSSARRKSTSDDGRSRSTSGSGDCKNDCCTTSVLGGFRSWPVDRDDFILIGECEEIQGPSTLLTIPENAAVNVDTNGLILQLLSADYQGLGEGSMIPYEDTQALLPDIQPDIHVIVNYFVLLDIQARGYVRPMCVAYVTSDKFKLAKMFLPLRNALVQACSAIKSHNWNLFCEELKPMIEDLRYTKKVRESAPVSQSPSVVEKMQYENLDESLRDLEAKLDLMGKLVERERKHLDESSSDFLTFLHRHSNCPSYIHLDALLKYSEHEKTNVSQRHKPPQILKVPLRQNFGSVLRPVTSLSCLGIIKSVYELYKVLKYFERRYECIALTAKNEENIRGMCLHFASCVKEVCLCGNTDTNKFGPNKDMHLEEYNLGMLSNEIDEEFFKLFGQITQSRDESGMRCESLCESRGHNILDESRKVVNVSSRLEKQLKVLNKRHDLCLNQMFDVIEKLQGSEIEETALSVLQSVFHKEELFCSVLKGRTILIIASAEQRHLVEALVAILSIISPTSSRHPKSSELWTTRDIQESDLCKFSIIGMQCTDDELSSKVPKSVLPKCSVFNMKKKKLVFPHYKGELLVGIAKSIKNLPPKGPLLSVLVSFLSDLELKVQFFRLLIEARGEINALRHFLNKGYSEKDTDLLWRLNGLLE